VTHPIFTDEVLRTAAAVVAREPALPIATREDLAAIHGSSAECFARACERYAERTCLESALGTITYGALWDRAARLAPALVRGEHVGITGAPGIDWVVVDLACLIAGAVSVPLATNLARDELAALIAHAELGRIVCGASRIAALAEVVEPTRLISMHNDRDDAAAGPSTLAALAGNPRGPHRARDTDLVTIMYSSGTTGRPKGVMLGERRWRAHLETARGWPPFPHVWIGYLPHAQIAGRRLVLEPMMHGGVTHFATSALPLDDLRRVRPTIVPFLPRVSGILHQQFQSALVARHGTHEIALDDPRAVAVMTELRNRYATDRLCTVRVGSGSTPPAVLDFLARCFEVPVADGYGTTETGALAINGTLFPHVEYKLVDAAELGYTHPRGELLVRSHENTQGYFKDPEATAALFDDEGYIRTGDIVEERAPRSFTWLDRRSGVTKLAQGQFVATAQLEQLYATESALIEQIFLYANARHASLLAVVVTSASRAEIRSELDRIARTAGRPAHEVPRDFVIEREPFSTANELLTESGKQNQRRLHERYAPALDALYAEIETRQLSRAALDDPHADLAARVRAAVALTLGLSAEDVANAPPDVGFLGFGGDSLSALRLCALVEQALGVRVAVARVLDRSAGLPALIEAIAHRASGIAFEDVHAGSEPLATELVQLVPTAPLAAAPAIPRTVLVTGCTGFLGRMLVLALAERVRVLCVVRGADPSARLRAAALEAGVNVDPAIAAGRIVPIAGDFMSGLAIDEPIDVIVHAGALVNHALSYRHLFAPNVLGTRELMRLALERGAALCFLSSIGVAMQTVRHADSMEPGAGYVTSKWASEVMLEELHRRTGVPVSIIRCGNIAPHRDHPALNWADNTNRLLLGIVATGLAPETFHAARYDLVPLDAIVTAITAIATTPARGLSTVHATSDDEISLDTLVAWTESAGVVIERLPYAAWFRTWRARLEALPDPLRGLSALPAIDRWQAPVDPPRFDTTTYRALRSSVVDEPLVHRWIRALRDRVGR
jgi:fatty acid CoA ligase FadD9